MFFLGKVCLILPQILQARWWPNTLGNSSILSMSPQTVVGFCKYSRVFLNLVCGDKSHFYSTPLLVTAPTASMILDQVCLRIRKPSGNWPGRCLEIRPEVLRKTLRKVVRKIVRKTVTRNLQTPLFVVFGVPECRPVKLSGNLPKNCHENFRKKAQKIPGLVTDRSAWRAMSLFLGFADARQEWTFKEEWESRWNPNTDKKQDYLLRAPLSMVMSSRVPVCEGGEETSSWQLAPCSQAKILETNRTLTLFSHLRCCSPILICSNLL